MRTSNQPAANSKTKERDAAIQIIYTPYIYEGERAGVARLLADDKAFGRAMAYLIAYVRRHALVEGQQ